MEDARDRLSGDQEMTIRTLRVLALVLLAATGCTFDEFVDESYELILDRNPEMKFSLVPGAEEAEKLDDLSMSYLERTYELEAVVLEKLLEFDYEELTADQRVTYDLYRDFLELDLAGREFTYNNIWYGTEPRLSRSSVGYFYVRPMTEYADALQFARDLRQLKRRANQVADNHQAAVEAGLIPSRLVLDTTAYRLRYGCGQYEPDGEYLVYKELLQLKMEEAGLMLTPDQQAELDQEFERSTQYYKPACDKLLAVMDDAAEQAKADEAGAWVFPNGEDYYQYSLTFHNETSMSAHEVHDLGLTGTAEMHQRVRELLAPLGFPVGQSIPELMAAFVATCPRVTLEELGPYYTGVVDYAKSKMDTIVDLPLPSSELVLVYAEGIPGGYSPPGPDYPAEFYYGLPPGAQDTSSIALKTIGFHEVYPGHHMQLATHAEMTGVPLIRLASSSTAYVEGWGLYAERVALETGWYEETDVCGRVGQLMTEALRAVRLSADTGVNALRWTPEQTIAFMDEQLGVDWGPLANRGEVYGMIDRPAYKTAYYIGMHEMLALREKAREKLGIDFDLREFNGVLLGSGSVSVRVLEQMVDNYLADKP
jgi:uncharacterized protein (DUF885 family)